MSLSVLYSIDFTKAVSQAPLSDSNNWATIGSFGLEITNNLCQGTNITAPGNAFGESALVGPTLPMDQYGQFTVGTLTSSSTNAQLIMWIRASGVNPGSNDGYRRLTVGSTGGWLVHTRISGSLTSLGSGTTTINSGDVFVLQAQGNNVVLTQNGVALLTTTDATVSSFTNQALEINAGVVGQVATVFGYAAGGFSTGPATHGWSPVDSRVTPNTGVIQDSGAVFYDLSNPPTCNAGGLPVDDRAEVPVDSRSNKPLNSRTEPPF